MIKTDKNFRKYIAFTAIIGTVIAALTAHFHFQKKKDQITNFDNNPEDDFDAVDLNTLDNDTPREYVAIKINTKNS